jgi:CheY-like chemotaxis protein
MGTGERVTAQAPFRSRLRSPRRLGSVGAAPERSGIDALGIEGEHPMLLRGLDAAMIFADIRLSGAMDGVDLAREAKMRWPHLTVVLTSGAGGEHLQHLPPGVIYLSKPWEPLEVLGLAEKAKLSAQQRKIYGR